MASSSGNSSTTTTRIQSFGSEEDLQVVMDQRRNKRKQSNRESARRSRMRKQSHMDDLVRQVSQLTKDNSGILTNITMTTQHYLTVEAENSILRAQLGELSHRLQSLNDIITLINTTSTTTTTATIAGAYDERDCYLPPPIAPQSFFNPMNMLHHLNQPISASADIFQW